MTRRNQVDKINKTIVFQNEKKLETFLKEGRIKYDFKDEKRKI